MTSGYKNSAGTDFDSLYELMSNPNTVPGDVAENVGYYDSAGGDIGARYVKASRGTAGANNGYKNSAGTDIGTLFAQAGTVSYYTPGDWGAGLTITKTGDLKRYQANQPLNQIQFWLHLGTWNMNYAGLFTYSADADGSNISVGAYTGSTDSSQHDNFYEGWKVAAGDNQSFCLVDKDGKMAASSVKDHPSGHAVCISQGNFFNIDTRSSNLGTYIQSHAFTNYIVSGYADNATRTFQIFDTLAGALGFP